MKAVVSIREREDGPIEAKRSIECDHCHNKYTDDIYVYRHRVLCGCCRYKMRHGRLPDRKPSYGIAHTGSEHDRAFHGGSENHPDQEWWGFQIGGGDG